MIIMCWKMLVTAYKWFKIDLDQLFQGNFFKIPIINENFYINKSNVLVKI